MSQLQPEPGRLWTLGLSKARTECCIDTEHTKHAAYDVRVEVTDSDTLFELTNVLCNGLVKQRRESDYGVRDHVWVLTFYPAGTKLLSNSPAERLIQQLTQDESSPQQEKCIGPNEEASLEYRKCEEKDGAIAVKVNTKVGELKALQIGSIIHFAYDVGVSATTNIFLSVLSVTTIDTKSALRLYDSGIGQSDALPPKAPALRISEEAIMVSPPNDLPRVTAVALTGSILYTGHHDSSLRKWDLETNSVLWRVKVFRDWTPTEPKFTEMVTGIRGITIHEGEGGLHTLYTWSHYIEDDTWKERKPAKIKVVNADGTLSHILSCKLGEDDSHPLISCITYGLCAEGNNWKETLFVGLEASALVDNYETNFEDYDLEYAQDIAEGNILPIDITTRQLLETWRGHQGSIRSLAVVTQKYVVSVSECPRTMFPESAILWDLKHRGIPLHRIDFYPSQGRCNYPPFSCVKGGIAVYGNNCLLGCEFGDVIVPIDVVDADSSPRLSTCGFANLGQRFNEESSFLGCMAGSGNLAAIANESSTDVYLFLIDTASSNPNLNRVMNKAFSAEKLNESDMRLQALKARSMAAGIISFPLKCRTKVKKRKATECGADSNETSDDNENSDWFGDDSGGPECLALSGKWLVATFGNSGIMKSELPTSFAVNGESIVQMRSSSRPAFENEEIEVPHLDYLDNHTPPQRAPGEPCSIM